MLLLQCPCDDLGGRSRARIDQYNDGQAVGEVAFPCEIAFDVTAIATALRNDFATIEERVGNFDSFIEQTAGI